MVNGHKARIVKQLMPERKYSCYFVFVLIFSMLVLQLGCASYTSIDDKGRVVVHHFGYVKLVKPPVYPNNMEINVTGVTLVGFSVGDGFTLGYKNSKLIQVPMDCRVLIIVKDAAQFNHMLDEFSDVIKGEDICATVSPE